GPPAARARLRGDLRPVEPYGRGRRHPGLATRPAAGGRRLHARGRRGHGPQPRPLRIGRRPAGDDRARAAHGAEAARAAAPVRPRGGGGRVRAAALRDSVVRHRGDHARPVHRARSRRDAARGPSRAASRRAAAVPRARPVGGAGSRSPPGPHQPRLRMHGPGLPSEPRDAGGADGLSARRRAGGPGARRAAARARARGHRRGGPAPAV
ncbi:MAG: hypothetical protein AVDCRST_MAG38-2976, partial [uncultured Solirubrobacteraceae bacterium]